MKQRLILLLYIWCNFLVCCLAQKEDLNALYDQLDQAISLAPHYKQLKEERIMQLKQKISSKKNKYQLLKVYRQLYEEYKAYKSDSAILYLQKSILLANKANMQTEANDLRSLLALQYSTTGAFTEAIHVLNGINKEALNKNGKKDYYIAFYHVYGELGFNNIHIDEDLSQEYYSKQNHYRDSLFAILPPHNEEYLMRKEVMLNNDGKYQQAFKINDERLSKCKKGSHEYGIVAYFRYLIFRSLKDEENTKYWLLTSAICDVKNSINDQASLWLLADILSKEGNTERAYKYINFSWNANNEFSTRIRSWQISPTLGTIDHNYQKQLKKANDRLTYAIFCVSLLVIVLAFSAYYVNKQKKLVTDARNELKNINERLEKLNHELSSTNNKLKASNEKLNESNGVKEEYIGQFLGACSHYIDKLDKMRLNINKLVKARKYQEIFDITKSSEIKEKELEGLYTNFDRVFLHLFPNFVSDLNGLLKPEYQIHLADPTKFSAMVRVFALIRLGIDDSTKIAEFLHYAVNTIYNYRAKLRNGAIGDRNEFEKKVKELGILDRK